MSNTLSNGVRVKVKASFWEERSEPEQGRWAFTYTVTLTNEGQDAVTLKSRHWMITDADGRTEEVRGEGVVGKQPKLQPGESFEYTSWAMLKTSFGSMRGEYTFHKPDGSKFEAKIGEFALVQPHALH